jgi:hypothetical protein
MDPARHDLYQATVRLGQELHTAKSALTVYTIIGRNAKAILDTNVAVDFFGLVQNQSLAAATLGVCKVFERQDEEPDSYQLCSVSGVRRLAAAVGPQDRERGRWFSERYGAGRAPEWIDEFDQVRANRGGWVGCRIRKMITVRDTWLAHAQLNAPKPVTPGVQVFDELLAFGVDVHRVINEVFLDTGPHPIMQDGRIAFSVLTLLERLGIPSPHGPFDEINVP